MRSLACCQLLSLACRLYWLYTDYVQVVQSLRLGAGNTVSTLTPSFVMVPVPVDRLPEVYRLLGQMPGEGASDDQAARPAWSSQDIAKLARTLGPDKAARAILDLGSEQPGQPVWFGDVCERVGRSHHAVRSELGGFTRMLRVQFGRIDWPFRAEGVNGRVLYTVDEAVARAWREHSDPAHP